MSNDLKWMLSSDQQFPYQDDKAIELWFKVMKWFKPDVVDYLGDTWPPLGYAPSHRAPNVTSAQFGTPPGELTSEI